MTKRWTIKTFATLIFVVCGAWFAPNVVQAVVPVRVNADYASSPPFVSNIATPNILVIMDNSGSMANRACESASCGILPDGTTSTVTTFVATTRYNGFADPLRCYVWDATDNRFENGAVKAALNTACSSTQWDGNFINWASFRRFDAVKKAMTGGNCWHPTASPVRNADGTCKPSGTPSLPTVRVQNLGTGTEVTIAIPYSGGTGNASYVGRIPTASYPGTPPNIYVQIQSTGNLCIDDDNGGGCPDSGGFAETVLPAIAFAMDSEPTGVIQQIGDKARFGLAVFNASSSDNGIKVLTGIGSRQSIDFSGSTVETFNTNTAAMVDAVDEAYPATWTPLAESLYDAVRYVAQINSAYYPTTYTFPIAFSGGSSNGVAFQATGVGSVGGSEVSALIGTETCPSGYITSACGRDPYFFGANHTPAWASTSQVVNCCKTFILIFTDGEPTEDQNIPAGLRDNSHNGVDCTGSDGAAPPRPVDGTCNTHPLTPFSVLLGEHKTDYASSGSGYLDSVAYWAHTNDIRPCSGTGDGTIAVIGVTGHCLPGTQNVTVYTFFAFGNINGRGILAQTARLGAFEDADNDGIPDAGEWDKENNYTGASGADGIPDAYFESSDVDDIQDKMLATLSSIIRKSTSGAAVSVLATSSTGEGALYQAYFYPSTLESATNKDVTWTGYTQSLWVDGFGNLREDTVSDGKQDYKLDLIVKTRLDPSTSIVYVDKYTDADGNGIADDMNSDGVITQADCTICNQLLSDIKPIWEAGKQLALKDASARTILTWVDTDNDGVVDAGEEIAFSTANSATLGPYLRAAAAPSAYTADAIINFVRGCEVATCTEQAALRDRRLQVPVTSGTLKVWKLGDVVDAPPTIVAAPRDRYDIIEGDPSYSAFFVKYRTRRQVVYVGANDGMLHAFNAGFYHPGDDPSTTTTTEHGWFTRTPTNNSSGPLLGEELWGFIPYQLLPHLQWLTRSDYQHVYYVDMPPVVKDVRIFANDTDHPNGWGTVLIGGFRLGGSCGACTPGGGGPPMGVTISGTDRYFYSAYFVLDITNPEAPPKLLWSFSDSTLGLTTSVPTVVRVNPFTDYHTNNANAKWYLLAGSGPTGYDGRATQAAKVFAVNMQTGPGSANSLVTSFQTGSWASFIGDMTAFDRNLDYRTDVVYFGRVINDGSLPWRGKVYRLTLGSALPFGGETAAASWGIDWGGTQVPTEMLDEIGFSTPVEMGPVMAAPTVTVDDAARAWVFVGSGRYFGASDKTDKTTQYFVGMKDSVINGDCVQYDVADCHDSNLVDVTTAQICVVGYGNCGQTAGTNQVTGVTGVSTQAQLMSLVGSSSGWVTRLVPASGPGVGERVLSAATVFGGIVFFPTFTPTDDVCASTGSSNLYALFYKTGGPHTAPVVGTTSGAGGIVNVNKSTSLGSGLAFGAVPHVGSGADGTSPYKLFINTSSGALDGRDVNLAIDPRAHFASWINM
ncbi:MAG: hypothetical protein HP497_07580 [Nitrospira sp.]|nr:hypothetical protein [Nitrospira sp.]